MSSSSNPRAQARAAALAAAEARLRPPPSYDSASASTSPTSSTTPGQLDTTASCSTNASNPALSTTGLFGRPSASPSPALTLDSYRPSEKDDRDARIKFGRLLDRGIIRDNGYRQSAEAVETLLKIANNILTSDDPKYRTLKSSNTLLKTKVLSAKGGQDYLIALGFRTQTVDFTQYFVFNSTLKKRHELEIGVSVLREHTQALQDRVALSNTSATAHAQTEAARRAVALREIDADRDSVRLRAEREKISRAAREQMERERLEREAAEEAEGVVDAADEERREMRDAVVRPPQGGGGGRSSRRGNEEQEAEEQEGDEGREGAEQGPGEQGEEGDGIEDDDDELPSYTEDRESRRWGGPGRRLGA